MAVIDVTINPIASLYEDLEAILKSCVIKYSYNAEMFETLENRKNSDEYFDALYGTDTFFIYTYKFDDFVKAIKEANREFQMTEESRKNILSWQRDLNKVPKALQSILLKNRRKDILENYEEQNNYYRMLNGQPDLEDHSFFYINDDFIKKYGLEDLHLEWYDIDPTIPIHEIEKRMGIRYMYILESLGVFTKLREEYPEKTYLNYLGENRIDISVSRKAKNFELLRVTTTVREITLQSFVEVYEKCREYFVNTIFIPEHRNSFAYYDNFIAMCIMAMTFQQIFARTISYAIDREFFDDYMVQLLYSTYGLPYERRLPYEVQRRIVKNLNVLIQNKATNQVIYDVAYLLGFHNITINKYYLVKERLFDSKGNLIYHMKDTYDDDGNVNGQTYDLELMYDVYFQKVDLKTKNLYQAITDPSNYADYNSITMNDPMWWDDEELWKEIYEREFNFVETKYLGITLQYKLSEMVFANIILFRMAFDKKEEFKKIMIDLPKITEHAEVSLFDTIVIMCAMICKKYHINGDILTDVSKILHVMDETNNTIDPSDIRVNTAGFNFQAVSKDIIDPKNCIYRSCVHWKNGKCDLDEDNCPCNGKTHLEKNTEHVREFLTKEEEIEFDKYFDTLEVDEEEMEGQVEAFNALYKDIRGLFDYISNKLSYTDTIEEYIAYRNLYRALYIMREENELFKKGYSDDSPVASTFLDYLKTMQPAIADFIEKANDIDLYVAIDHIISQLEEVLGELGSLHLVNDGTSILQEYLIKLIRFFKSYTTDLVSLGVIYVFDFKPDNMLRLIDKVGKIRKTIIVGNHRAEALHLGYSEGLQMQKQIEYREKNMKFHDSLKIKEEDDNV